VHSGWSSRSGYIFTASILREGFAGAISVVQGIAILLYSIFMLVFFGLFFLHWYMFGSFLGIVATFYVFKGYLLSGPVHSESCFFMPCAPQSISDTDQAGALFLGIALFIGVEVSPPLYGMLKHKYREDEGFRRVINKRILMGLMRDAINEITGSDGERSTPIMATGRVNSGIRLEEGLVTVSRRGTGIGTLRG